MTAYRNRRRFRSQWKFSTWIFTIANRLAVSSRRRRRLPTLGAGVCDERVSEGNPLAEAQDKELRSNLWDAAQKILEPDAFAAVWLSYVESMPAGEIGLVLGRNANAVRILLHRARASLAKRLGAAWKIPGDVL